MVTQNTLLPAPSPRHTDKVRDIGNSVDVNNKVPKVDTYLLGGEVYWEGALGKVPLITLGHPLTTLTLTTIRT